MQDTSVCPFFGKNEDYCDVGCDYISNHDIRMIVDYCADDYTECMKFRELASYHPEMLHSAAHTSNQQDIREREIMSNQFQNMALKDTTGNPAPLGLLGFGMTTVLLNLHNAGFFPLDAMILAMGIFYGGLGQIIVGIMEWKKNNTFAATAFTSYGLFWLTLVALILLPKTGVVPASTPQAMGFYLTCWGLFTAVLFLGTFRLSRALQVVFGSLVVLFFLLAAGDFTGNATLKVIAGYEGIFCGLSAIYTGLAQVINELFEREVAPLGAVPVKIK
ncbi:MAG: acetate uptake transporter [Desulfuromonadaceae bacterium]|nr:acetate uptake transporter [Desulfuromonas sp.]MDY0185829.1 acetate uptake transporter [Desulfuromonadaceae bacterium]